MQRLDRLKFAARVCILLCNMMVQPDTETKYEHTDCVV